MKSELRMELELLRREVVRLEQEKREWMEAARAEADEVDACHRIIRELTTKERRRREGRVWWDD